MRVRLAARVVAIVLAVSACGGGGGAPTPGPRTTGTPADPRPAFPLSVSSSGRYLVDRSGVPFLYAADTAWTLLSMLGPDDARRLIDMRKAQGFTAIQTILTPFTITTSGPRGTPFDDADLTRPRPSYWEGVDEIVRYADRRGMLLYVAPLWMADNGGWTCEDGPCSPVPTARALRAYSTWVGRRYRSQPNLVWAVGGDDETDRHRDVKLAGARALHAADPDHLVTYHPRWDDFGFAGESWLGFHSFQKNDLNPPYAYEQVRRGYGLTPTKPVLDAEPPYDPQTAMQDGDVTTARTNRRFGWWAMLSGAMGVAYGGPPGAWKIGLDGPPDWSAVERDQARQTAAVRRILAPLPWYDLVPDWDDAVVTAGRGTYGGDDYATAGRTADGSLVVAFAPSARSLTVDLGSLPGPGVLRWFDPTTGRAIAEARRVEAGGTLTVATPGANAAGDDDWVLVVDARPAVARSRVSG